MKLFNIHIYRICCIVEMRYGYDTDHNPLFFRKISVITYRNGHNHIAVIYNYNNALDLLTAKKASLSPDRRQCDRHDLFWA